MTEYKITESEYRFLKIIWDNGEITSSKLVDECKDIFDWKKSTTYTMIKRLSEKGFIENNKGIVTSLISRNQVDEYQSNKLIDTSFDGSLPKFIASFMGNHKITKEQAEYLKQLIDSYSE